MVNNLLSQDLTQTALSGFEQGQETRLRGERRNALSDIAGAIQEGDLAQAGQRAADIGDVELVTQIKGLMQAGRQAELDMITRSSSAIRNALAAAETARRQNPQNFPAVAEAMAQQFQQANPDFGFTPDQVLGALLDPNQGAAALAQVEGLDGALQRAKFEFDQEKQEQSAGLAERRFVETQRSNLAREELGRQQRQVKVDEKAAAAATAEEKQRIKAQAVTDDLTSTQETVGRLKDHPGLKFAVGLRRPFAAFGGTSRADFEAIVETVKARLGFAELARMRAASPTGGALGQISERELSFLQAANQSLDTSQTEQQFLENVKLIEESIDRLLAVQKEAVRTGQIDEDLTTLSQEELDAREAEELAKQ